MARFLYGHDGGAQVVSPTGTPTVASATVYNARTGGSVVSDITTIAGGALAGVVTPVAGTGQIRFMGPDTTVDTLWLDFGAGDRWAIKPTDVDDQISLLVSQLRAAEFSTPDATTPKAGLPYMNSTIGQTQMTALDSLVTPAKASQAARDSAYPSPVDGNSVYRTDEHVRQTYNAGPARWVNAPTLIAETVFPNSTTNSVTFSGIPQTYKHLRIVYSGRIASAGSAAFTQMRMNLNGNVGSVYRWCLPRGISRFKLAGGVLTYHTADDGTGGSTTAAALTEAAYQSASLNAVTAGGVGYMPGTGTNTASRGGGDIMIMDYANASTYKNWVAYSAWIASSPTTTDGWQLTGDTCGQFVATGAVTSVQISANASGLFTTGTVVSLYGVS